MEFYNFKFIIRMVSQRLQEEIKALRVLGSKKGFMIKENSELTYICAIPGPESSPWKGGLYSLVITFSKG